MSPFVTLGARLIAGLFFVVLFVVGDVPPAASQSPGGGGELCASEDGYCRFSGSRYVRYGAGDRFTVRLLTDGTACTNTVFGDPTPNVRKACYLDVGAPARRAVLCANEDGRCAFTGSRFVYYGAGDRYAVRLLTNGADCTNAVFGDPVPGVRKVCYLAR